MKLSKPIIFSLFSLVALGCIPDLAPIPKEALTPEGAQAVQQKHNIVIVADAGMDANVMARTIIGFRRRYGLSIKNGPTFSKTIACRSEARKQVEASCLLDALDALRQREKTGSNTTYIGVLTQDMWIASVPNWKWAFSLRREENRIGVVSIAHMGKFGGSKSIGESRLRKMLLKNVAILAFGIYGSDDPESVLSKPILGTADLDRLGEKF